MLIIAIVLIVVGALLLALVHPADADGRRLRNFGAGALIVAGVILLVVVLAGVFDTEADVDTGLLAPTVLLGRLLCRLGVHGYPRSQGAVGYCARGCGDLKRVHNGGAVWTRYTLPPTSPPPRGMPRR